LDGKTASPPVELGIDVAGLFMTLRISEDGPHVRLRPDRRPDTILEAEPETVLRLAAGGISIEEALSRASIHGDPGMLTMLAGARG
jgi:hypothetical protein